MVDTHDTQCTKDNRRWTTPGAWHKPQVRYKLHPPQNKTTYTSRFGSQSGLITLNDIIKVVDPPPRPTEGTN